jgi:hypothetical protein
MIEITSSSFTVRKEIIDYSVFRQGGHLNTVGRVEWKEW